MKKAKKYLSLLVVFVMLCSMTTLPVLADDYPIRMMSSEYDYSVELSTDSNKIEEGTIIYINVDVLSDIHETYNSFYAKIEYDTSLFTYNEDHSELNGFSVSVGRKVITISKTGENINISTNADLILAFTVKGEADKSGDFTLTSAKVDSVTVEEASASDAECGDSLSIVIVGPCAVNMYVYPVDIIMYADIYVNDTLRTEDYKLTGNSIELFDNVSFGDTITVVPEPGEGYAVRNIACKNDVFIPDSDGKFSLTVTAGNVGDNNIFECVINGTKLKTVKIDEKIINGTLITDWQEGYCGYITNSDGTDSSVPVTLTVVPDDGYRIESVSYSYDKGISWTEISSDNDGSYKVTPAADVIVTAKFAEMDKIQISSENELREFADAVNNGKNYKNTIVVLTDDIKLTDDWIPIGTKKNPFEGTFNGEGHTISGLNIINEDGTLYYVGLFGYSKGEIKKVTVDGNITLLSKDYIENALDYRRIGGIVGETTADISDCVSIVDIEADCGYIGGIAGWSGSIYSCINYGNIHAGHDKDESMYNYALVGGISALLKDNGAINECVNYGALTALCFKVTMTDQDGNYLYDKDAPFVDMGGIVGSISSNCNIKNSANKGSLSGIPKSAGGIAATLLGENAVIQNCYNTGSITVHNILDKHNKAYAAGLLSEIQYKAKIFNSYSTNSVIVTSGSEYVCTGELYNISNKNYSGSIVTENCYGPSDIAELKDGVSASVMGDAYKEDKNNVNGGYPLLLWEDGNVKTETYLVTFNVSPVDANITIYSDAAMTQIIQPESDGYKVTMGNYYYKIEADGYVGQSGSFFVSVRPITVDVTLRLIAKMTFAVDPAEADFVLYDNGDNEIEPDSCLNGTYIYTLYSGTIYTYDVNCDGYNTQTRECVAVNGGIVEVVLTEAVSDDVITDTVYGSSKDDLKCEINKGGIYRIGEGSSGMIYVKTSEEVTLVGRGVGIKSIYENLYIDCASQITNLTLQDVYISNSSGKSDSNMTNMVNFYGVGNILKFKGVSILDQNTNATGYAMVHVPDGTSLTVTGGTAYFYKREQGAGIGGNGGASGGEGQEAETNGDITIRDAVLFMKNSKQGALIGAGASAGSQTPGNIVINNSDLNLIAVSRGAAIGGSAGSSGASAGSNVKVSNSCININVDYSGSAIGGGGYDAGNDSDGGSLYVSNSSVRTFIDTNAVSLWNVDASGVNENMAITADTYTVDGDEAYLLVIDTSKLSDAATSFIVKEGDSIIYSGGLHKYSYINEEVSKSGQIDITYTIDNWIPLKDNNLYLYVSGKNHILSVNGEIYSAKWDSEKKSFIVKKGEIVSGGDDENISISIGNGSAAGTTVDGVTTFKAGTSESAPTVTVTAPENGWKSGENTFTVSAEKACTVIVKNADGTYTKLAAAAVSDAENTYSFTTSESFDADCEIIVSMTGDIDGDGTISQADYLSVLSAVRGASLEGTAALRADVNSDSSISQVDYLSILSAIRGASLSW